MEWLIGLGGLYLFFKIGVPLLLLGAIVYFAAKWANADRPMEFTSAEPHEYRRDLEDDLSDDVRGPRIEGPPHDGQ